MDATSNVGRLAGCPNATEIVATDSAAAADRMRNAGASFIFLFSQNISTAGSPSRLDKLRPLFGEIAQDFNERFREEAR